jgi:hypothetical protein
VLTAPADLDNEVSNAWQQSPSVYQKVTATIAPNVDGHVVVRVCLATGEASSIFVDPKVYVS